MLEKQETNLSINSTDEILHLDPKEEARVVRKLDRNALPILGLLYFLCALDRSNIGNSVSAGLQESISLTDSQYSDVVSLLYVTYILSEMPGTLLLKKLKPHRHLAICGFCWSLVTIGTTFVRNYGDLLACRMLLGLFEGSYFPCIMLYVSIFYKKEEQGLRMALLLLCAGLAGAFGGLISYALVHVQTTNPWLQGYRLIFLVEGLITVCAIPLVVFWLPDDETSGKFLNEKDREIMAIRAQQRATYMGEETFLWIEIKKAFMDPKTYFSMIIQFCQDLILYSFSTFLPNILKSGLGYSATEAQYMTIPVYIVSVVAVIGISFLSDRAGVRGPFIAGANVLGIIGYIIMLASSNNKAKYFACYLISFPLYICPGLNLSWTSNNSYPHYRRAASMGANQTLGNLSGVIAGQVYRKSPFVLGNSFGLGCLCVSCIAVCLNTLWLRYLNNEKDKILNGEKDDKKTERTGDHELDFRYCY